MHIEYETNCVVREGKSSRIHKCVFLLPYPNPDCGYVEKYLSRHLPPVRSGYARRKLAVSMEEAPIETNSGTRYKCVYEARDEEDYGFDNIENHADFRIPFSNKYSIKIALQDDGLLIKHVSGVFSCFSDLPDTRNRCFWAEDLKRNFSCFESWRAANVSGGSKRDEEVFYKYSYVFDHDKSPIFNTTATV